VGRWATGPNGMEAQAHVAKRVTSGPGWRRIVAIVTICMSLTVCLGILLASCFTRQPGCPYLRWWLHDLCEFPRTFPVESLLVEESNFPFDVTIDRIEPIGLDGAVERAIITVSAPGSGCLASHEIERWAWVSQADRNYIEIDQDPIPSPPPCGMKSNVPFQSVAADRFCAACSVGGHCKSVAQYQEYISIFELELSANVTQSDFEAIIRSIDARFIQLLELD
jgi:hypothetical protein